MHKYKRDEGSQEEHKLKGESNKVKKTTDLSVMIEKYLFNLSFKCIKRKLICKIPFIVIRIVPIYQKKIYQHRCFLYINQHVQKVWPLQVFRNISCLKASSHISSTVLILALVSPGGLFTLSHHLQSQKCLREIYSGPWLEEKMRNKAMAMRTLATHSSSHNNNTRICLCAIYPCVQTRQQK